MLRRRAASPAPSFQEAVAIAAPTEADERDHDEHGYAGAAFRAYRLGREADQRRRRACPLRATTRSASDGPPTCMEAEQSGLSSTRTTNVAAITMPPAGPICVGVGAERPQHQLLQVGRYLVAGGHDIAQH